MLPTFARGDAARMRGIGRLYRGWLEFRPIYKFSFIEEVDGHLHNYNLFEHAFIVA